MPLDDSANPNVPSCEPSSRESESPDTISAARRQLGAAAILSVAEAARLLPIRESDAAMWLVTNKLIRDLDGRRVVLWADVVARIRGDEGQPSPPRARLPRAGLPRGPK